MATLSSTSAHNLLVPLHASVVAEDQKVNVTGKSSPTLLPELAEMFAKQPDQKSHTQPQLRGPQVAPQAKVVKESLQAVVAAEKTKESEYATVMSQSGSLTSQVALVDRSIIQQTIDVDNLDENNTSIQDPNKEKAIKFGADTATSQAQSTETQPRKRSAELAGFDITGSRNAKIIKLMTEVIEAGNKSREASANFSIANQQAGFDATVGSGKLNMQAAQTQFVGAVVGGSLNAGMAVGSAGINIKGSMDNVKALQGAGRTQAELGEIATGMARPNNSHPVEGSNITSNVAGLAQDGQALAFNALSQKQAKASYFNAAGNAMQPLGNVLNSMVTSGTRMDASKDEAAAQARQAEATIMANSANEQAEAKKKADEAMLAVIAILGRIVEAHNRTAGEIAQKA